MKIRLLLLAVGVLLAAGGSAQTKKGAKKPSVSASADTYVIDSVNFCNGMAQLLKDAKTDFERIKGDVIENTASGTIHSARQGLPGAKTVSITNEGHSAYQAVVYEGTSQDIMTDAYMAYKLLVAECMADLGYILNNDGKGVADYMNTAVPRYCPKKGGAPYVYVTANHTELNGIYTVMVCINTQ